MKMKWQTQAGLLQLLTSLAEYPSVTGSASEIAISEFIYGTLQDLNYFQNHPHDVRLHPLSDGRNVVTAFVKNGQAKKTVILLSHFDVVDVADFGGWSDLAFKPQALTAAFKQSKHELSAEIQAELDNGEWLFGRGTMDMKAGLALHMAMIEQASYGKFDGNLLLVTVPDEEANSFGMRCAVSIINHLAVQYELEYQACFNSEPSFATYPGDVNHYVYTGSIGKILPGFYCYGKETHVGDPFSGLNANLMAAKVSEQIELNLHFCDERMGEIAPPPTSLNQSDLKTEYSVQIPHDAVAVFNLFMMKNDMHAATEKLLAAASEAARAIEHHYITKATAFADLKIGYQPQPIHVHVFTYEQILNKAIEQFGKQEIMRKQQEILASTDVLDDRDLTIRLVQDLAASLKSYAPMIILYYSPPFYPAVCSSDHELIAKTVIELQQYCQTHDGISLKQQHFFSGLSDLSYAGVTEDEEMLTPLITNMPLLENGYHFPMAELKKLGVPVLNLGPAGRDPHKWTERLELGYSFGILHDLLPFTIHQLLK